MVVASQVGFFIMGPGLRGSYLQGVSTYSRRIMLQRIHHMGRTDASHYSVCCGDLTAIKIFSPKNRAVYNASSSSPANVEVQAVVLNPLNGSRVFAHLENSLGNEPSLALMSILPGTGRVIQSGRVLDPIEPDNMSYLWHTHFFVSIPGNYILSASIIIIAYYFFRFSLTFPFWPGLQRSRNQRRWDVCCTYRNRYRRWLPQQQWIVKLCTSSWVVHHLYSLAIEFICASVALH